LSTFVYWRMNWHMEHHMYAGAPCYNLHELSRTIADDLPEPRTLVGAWREMRATWKRQRIEPDYQYDTPVPTPGVVKDARARDDDALGASIGDLAPGILARAGA
jgi:fatty acid desaturase